MAFDLLGSYICVGRCLASSPYPFVCLRQALLLGVLFGGGCALSFRRFALGVGFGVILTKSDKSLEFLFWMSLVRNIALDLLGNYIASGRSSWRRFLLILTKSEKSLEFLFWLILAGRMAFDLLWNYLDIYVGRCLVSSSYPFVWPRQVLLLGVLFGGGFVLLDFRCWFWSYRN